MSKKPDEPNKRKSGRPKGATDKAPRVTSTRKIAALAVARGISPLDVMLSTMEDAWLKAQRLETEQGPPADIMALRAIANDAATRAAPYVHPKLSAIAVKEMRESSPINAAAIAAISPAERHMLLFALRKLLGADVEDAPVIEAVTDGGE